MVDGWVGGGGRWSAFPPGSQRLLAARDGIYPGGGGGKERHESLPPTAWSPVGELQRRADDLPGDYPRPGSRVLGPPVGGWGLSFFRCLLCGRNVGPSGGVGGGGGARSFGMGERIPRHPSTTLRVVPSRRIMLSIRMDVLTNPGMYVRPRHSIASLSSVFAFPRSPRSRFPVDIRFEN